MATMQGARLSEYQSARILIGQTKSLSGRFITAVQKIYELCQEEGNVWHEGAFKAAMLATAHGTVAKGILCQSYGRDKRDVIFSVMENDTGLKVVIEWPHVTDICPIPAGDEANPQYWRPQAGGLVWDKLHTFPVLTAA